MTQLVKSNYNQNNQIQRSAIDSIDKLLKYADALSQSTIIPAHYRGNTGDIFVAVQTAYRMNLDPMMVMQGTYIINGKLGMTSAFAISLANSSGLFTGGIRYRIEGEGNDLRVTAYTNLKSNGDEINYTIGMKEANAEGWSTKSGSKYKTMPELMLRYRAATLLIRTHAPEVINGMHMIEEIEDVQSAQNSKNAQSVIGTQDGSKNSIITNLDNFLDNEDDLQDKTIETVANMQESEKHNYEQLKELITEHNVANELVEKWCEAGGVTKLEQLKPNQLQSCIEYVQNRMGNNRLAENY